MFLQEFRNHPNIIKLRSIHRAVNDKDIYLVFEYMGRFTQSLFVNVILQRSFIVSWLIICAMIWSSVFEFVCVCMYAQACINAYAACAHMHTLPLSFWFTFKYDTTKCRTVLVKSTPCFPNALLLLYMSYWLSCSFNVGQIYYLQTENIFFPHCTQTLFFLVLVVFRKIKGRKVVIFDRKKFSFCLFYEHNGLSSIKNIYYCKSNYTTHFSEQIRNAVFVTLCASLYMMFVYCR